MTIVGNNNGRTNGIDISHIVQFLEIEPCRLEDRNWSRLILSFVIVIKFLSYDSHVEIQCLQWFYAGPCYTKSIVRTKMRHRETSPLDLSCATSYVTWRESLCRWNEPLHTLYTYISLHLVIGIKKKKRRKKKRENTSYRQRLLIRYDTTTRHGNARIHIRFLTQDVTGSHRVYAIERSMRKGISCEKDRQNCTHLVRFDIIRTSPRCFTLDANSFLRFRIVSSFQKRNLWRMLWTRNAVNGVQSRRVRTAGW